MNRTLLIHFGRVRERPLLLIGQQIQGFFFLDNHDTTSDNIISRIQDYYNWINFIILCFKCQFVWLKSAACLLHFLGFLNAKFENPLHLLMVNKLVTLPEKVISLYLWKQSEDNVMLVSTDYEPHLKFIYCSSKLKGISSHIYVIILGFIP